MASKGVKATARSITKPLAKVTKGVRSSESKLVETLRSLTRKPKIKYAKDQEAHIFRNSKKGGHFTKKTPQAEKAIKDTYRKGVKHGTDTNGNTWYTRTNKQTGEQNWAITRNGKIENAGVNKPENIRPNWDPKRGLVK